MAADAASMIIASSDELNTQSICFVFVMLKGLCITVVQAGWLAGMCFQLDAASCYGGGRIVKEEDIDIPREDYQWPTL